MASVPLHGLGAASVASERGRDAFSPLQTRWNAPTTPVDPSPLALQMHFSQQHHQLQQHQQQAQYPSSFQPHLSAAGSMHEFVSSRPHSSYIHNVSAVLPAATGGGGAPPLDAHLLFSPQSGAGSVAAAAAAAAEWETHSQRGGIGGGGNNLSLLTTSAVMTSTSARLMEGMTGLPVHQMQAPQPSPPPPPSNGASALLHATNLSGLFTAPSSPTARHKHGLSPSGTTVELNTAAVAAHAAATAAVMSPVLPPAALFPSAPNPPAQDQTALRGASFEPDPHGRNGGGIGSGSSEADSPGGGGGGVAHVALNNALQTIPPNTVVHPPTGVIRRVPERVFTMISNAQLSRHLTTALSRGTLSARQIQSVTAYLSESMSRDDFVRFARFVPVPVACSVRAVFAGQPAFLHWLRQRRDSNLGLLPEEEPRRARVSLRLHEDGASTSSSSGSGGVTPPNIGDHLPSAPIADLLAGIAASSPASVAQVGFVAPHVTGMLFEMDWRDSPLLCVEDEQLAAGVMSPRQLQQRALEVPLATLVLRSSRRRRTEKERRRDAQMNGAPPHAAAGATAADDATTPSSFAHSGTGGSTGSPADSRSHSASSCHSRSRSYSRSPSRSSAGSSLSSSSKSSRSSSGSHSRSPDTRSRRASRSRSRSRSRARDRRHRSSSRRRRASRSRSRSRHRARRSHSKHRSRRRSSSAQSADGRSRHRRSRERRRRREEEAHGYARDGRVTARELRRRTAAFLSRTPPHRYDEQRTVHMPDCSLSRVSACMEPQQEVREAPFKAAAATAAAAGAGAAAGVAAGSGDASTAAAGDSGLRGGGSGPVPGAPSSSSAAPPCDCPVLVRRGMFAQVNRAFERLLGWAQSDIRALFVHSGQRGAMAQLLNYGNLAEQAIEFHALNHLTLGRVDFSSCQPVRNRAGHQQTCIVQGKLLHSDSGDPDGIIYTFIAC